MLSLNAGSVSFWDFGTRIWIPTSPSFSVVLGLVIATGSVGPADEKAVGELFDKEEVLIAERLVSSWVVGSDTRNECGIVVDDSWVFSKPVVDGSTDTSRVKVTVGLKDDGNKGGKEDRAWSREDNGNREDITGDDRVWSDNRAGVPVVE